MDLFKGNMSNITVFTDNNHWKAVDKRIILSCDSVLATE